MEEERTVEGERWDRGPGTRGRSWVWGRGSVLSSPSTPHCPGPIMASCLRLLGGAGLRARPSRAQQGPFVTQRLPGPWPLVLGVQADWILSWQTCRCRTLARVALKAERSQHSLLLLASQRNVEAAVYGAGLWGPPGEGSLDPSSCWGPSCGLMTSW